MTTIKDLELSVRTQSKLGAQGIYPEDSVDKLCDDKGALTRERLVSLYGSKSAEDILDGFFLIGKPLYSPDDPSVAYQTTGGVSVVHRIPCEDHMDIHYVRVGKVGVHGRLTIRGSPMSVTLHHDEIGDVVGVEVEVNIA